MPVERGLSLSTAARRVRCRAGAAVAGRRIARAAREPPAPTRFEPAEAELRRRLSAWPAKAGIEYEGSVDEWVLSSYHTGETGGVARYSHATGAWKFACGGGGALDRASAIVYCGGDRKSAARLFLR